MSALEREGVARISYPLTVGIPSTYRPDPPEAAEPGFEAKCDWNAQLSRPFHYMLDVLVFQHLCSTFIELLSAADFFKPRQQVLRPQPPLFRAAKIMDDFSPVHHDQAVSQICGLVHRMGHHQRGQVLPGDHFLRQRNHQICALRVQRGSVFVQQQ